MAPLSFQDPALQEAYNLGRKDAQSGYKVRPRYKFDSAEWHAWMAGAAQAEAEMDEAAEVDWSKV